MSLYNLQVTRTPEGEWDITIKCLYAKIRAVIDLADEVKDRPDAREQAVALVAEKHDAACSRHCADSLKRGPHPTPVVMPSVTLEIGDATLTITDHLADIVGGDRPPFRVEIKCRHGTTGLDAKVNGDRPLPDAVLQRAYMGAARECGRRHRDKTGCDCVPDPDQEEE